MFHPVAAFQATQAMNDPYLKSVACPDCDGDPWPVIVPPVKDKQYSDKALQHIWNRAEQALRGAHEIVFAGYSLPESDDIIRQLLRKAYDSAHCEKVIVVDRDAYGVAERLKEVYGDLIHIGGSDWWEYLQQTENTANHMSNLSRK